MKKMTLARMLTATAVGVLLTASNIASAEGGWYVIGSYHQTELENASNKDRTEITSCVLTVCTTTVTETRSNSSFDDETHPGVSIGYDLEGPYRVDLEYLDFSNDVKNSGAAAGGEELDTQAAYFNLWRDFQVGSSVYPYIGGGLGLAKLEQGSVDDNVVVGQLGLGVAWYFTQRLALDLGYRYFISESDPTLEGGQRELETEYEGQTALIGLRYNFYDRNTAPKDGDGDGVFDDSDRCPATPRGVVVDVNGCAVDSDGDGLADYLDKCPNSEPGAVVDDTGCEEIKTIVLEGVNFETNSARLTTESQAICETVAAKLQTIPGKRYEVQGHTDDRGDDAYNMSLSQKRAEAVRACLIEQGVSGDRLEAAGYGETQPVVSNDSAAGRAKNRRVQLEQI